MTTECFAIPCYMPIKFSVAQAINTRTETDLLNTLYNLEMQAGKIDSSKVHLNDGSYG